MLQGKSLYKEASNNIFKTWLYMIFFIIFISAFGLLLAYYFNNVSIFYIAIIFSLCMNIFSYWYSDKIALKMAGAVEIKSRSQYPEYWNIVENLSITGGLPMPKIYIINDPIPNAFATGRNKNNSAIAATSGLLSMLNKNELEGVMAHELSHVENKDILLSTIVVIFVSIISLLSQMFFRITAFGGDGEDRKNSALFIVIGSFLAIILAPIAATIIQLAISRKREFLADASGAILTRYPEGLASALQKISQFSQPLKKANNATAHLYIVNPLGLNSINNNKKTSWISKLFMTHPPTEERINALLSINNK